MAHTTREKTKLLNRVRRMMRMAFTGSLSAILSPMSTAGMFASIMPRVVPITIG